ncbi:unnamed protein product [Pneumocystis jirovecii]|uniref:Uncharacterized protein n=1 Tax=Pneumocystis jirovecii TaxID=42068 RepID=L0P9M0_PNEJI|nr:unnamed protein product [Pneumocystis jirovecii]
METSSKHLGFQKKEHNSINDNPFLNLTNSGSSTQFKKQNLSNFPLSHLRLNKNINYESWQSFVEKENTNFIKKDQQPALSSFNIDELWESTNKLLANKSPDSLKKENHQINKLSTKSNSIDKHNLSPNKHIGTSKDMFSKTTNLYNLQASSPLYSETSPIYSHLSKNATLTDTQMSTIWNELSELKVRIKKLEIADKWRKLYKFDNLVTPATSPENTLSDNLTLDEEKCKIFHLLYASLEKMKSNGISKELWTPLEHIINKIRTFQDNNYENMEKKINNILRNLTELSLAIYDYHQSITDSNYSERKKRLDHLLLRRANSEQNITPLNRRNVKPFRNFYQSNDHRLYMKCNCNNNQYKNDTYFTYSKQKILETSTNPKIPFISENKTTNSTNTNFSDTPLRSNFINNSKYNSLNEHRNNTFTYFS